MHLPQGNAGREEWDVEVILADGLSGGPPRNQGLMSRAPSKNGRRQHHGGK